MVSQAKVFVRDRLLVQANPFGPAVLADEDREIKVVVVGIASPPSGG